MKLEPVLILGIGQASGQIYKDFEHKICGYIWGYEKFNGMLHITQCQMAPISSEVVCIACIP